MSLYRSSALPRNENQLEYAPIRRCDRVRTLRAVSGVGALLCVGLWHVTRFAWAYLERDQGVSLALIQRAHLVVTLLIPALVVVWLVMTIVAAVRRAG